MSRKQWGHGFAKGKNDGVVAGLEKAQSFDKQGATGEIDWIIENLSLFFVKPENIEPVAISKAITLCLQHKYKMENEKKDIE